jgi:hypothetical protein
MAGPWRPSHPKNASDVATQSRPWRWQKPQLRRRAQRVAGSMMLPQNEKLHRK